MFFAIIGSANHDESVFLDPDNFDVYRTIQNHPHAGFGPGIHFCVGASSARLEEM